MHLKAFLSLVFIKSPIKGAYLTISIEILKLVEILDMNSDKELLDMNFCRTIQYET